MPDPAAYDALLRRYVTPTGVRYRDWAAHPGDVQKLTEYLAALQSVAPAKLEPKPALAYWINLYNAATVHLILEHYPVKSIKDIGGVLSSPWKIPVATVGGKQFSLNQIENDVIRPLFHEPRIHFALNCASRSCPPLRAEAYDGVRLDTQLEEQTARFLGDQATNSVDAQGTIWLSKVFDWYAADFAAAGGSVLAFVSPYLGLTGSTPGAGHVPALRYRDYDWNLNESTTGE